MKRRPMPSLCESGETEEAEWEEVAGDYVFRIVNNAITDREGKVVFEIIAERDAEILYISPA